MERDLISISDMAGCCQSDCGIESLVEELCVKLKRVKEERDRGTKDGVGTSDEETGSPLKPGVKTEHHENPASQAAKYYQAFPALSDKTNTIMTSDPKPHGAWASSKKSPPDGQVEMTKRERKVVKSVSASSSRGSRSPARKHQRAKSLPNSMSHPDDNLTFVVPKYQSKKSYGRKQVEGKPSTERNGEIMGRVGDRIGAVTIQAKNLQQPCAWERKERTQEVLNVSPSQSPEFEELLEDAVVDEKEISWFTEPVIPVLDRGKGLSKLQTVYQSGASSPCVKTSPSEISLEEAVNSLAESLCRDIFEDDQCNVGDIQSEEGPVPIQEVCEGDMSPHVPQLVTAVHSLLEGDSAERGRHGDKPDLLSLLDSSKSDAYACQGRNVSSLQAMPLLVVDSQASLSMRQGQSGKDTDVECMAHQTLTSSTSSSQEHLEDHTTDLGGAPYPLSCIWDQELPPAKEPWERSPQKLNASNWPDQQECSKEQCFEQSHQECTKIGNVQDLPEALKVMVDHDRITVSAVGSLREEESLLRICCPTHSHHQCPATSAVISQFLPGHFPFSEEAFGPEAPLPSPNSVLSCSDPGSPFYSESEQDSLAKGIISACNLDESTPTAADVQPLDINSALWSTYDTQPRYYHPPKIVRWEDGSFVRGGLVRRRKSSFIEGGVYGSPYSSQNNSHYNSCSTSPCESGSLRDLWNPAAVQEVSALVTSMKELISPESGSVGRKSESGLSDSSAKKGAATPEQVLESSQQDEQSLIEDSLMDSPVFICSRSSSRFEFARSVSDLDGSLSPASAAGTETDEMVSEAELLEEVLKDPGEMEEMKECNKKVIKSKLDAKDDEWSDSLKQSFQTDGSSQELTPSWLTPPQQGSASGFTDDLCSEKSQGSLSLTGIVPTISKPEAIRKGRRPFDLAVGGSSPMRQKADLGDGSLAMDELLISPKTHFRPIHESLSPDESSGDEDADESRVLDSPHPGSLDKLTISKVVGSAPRKSPSSDQGPMSNPLEVDLGSFHASSPSKARSDYTHDDGAWVKGQGGHPANYASLQWVVGQHGEHYNWTDGEGHVEAPVGVEMDPIMHLDYENQMFAFEDEASLKGEELANVGGGTVKAVYSSQLEEMWLGEAANDAKQSRPPWRKHRRKIGFHKKPCSFFLEGKCRRTDCPFAHDVSSIVCRFWEEGQCLKGGECPFMHGYPSEIHSSEDRLSPVSKYGQVEALRRKKNTEDGDGTWHAHTQMTPSSSRLTSEGSVPFPRNQKSLGQLPLDVSPKHARSLPINIRSKPR
ncbi:uncharacterized protein LOC110979933 isoform X2 [Acanthaster planci]|uniref:Uncharacterized protein LOC110979933 isoform X2 n=1 Tax=Acanthaster planci TaxID=133434 RepID=A0A8B7YHD9_ACAPL|nr:uncharacterized protein LOC110979933 isoform X2 [Acanthaster planci]